MKYHLIISGEIGSWWNGVDAEYVRYLCGKFKDEELHVGFCSLGGSVKDALEMHEAFKSHGNVTGHAFAMNASASTIAMLGCKKITIVKNSFFLIHNASMAVRKWENQNKEQIDEFVKTLQKTQGELETIDDVLAQMYAGKCGKPVEDIKAQMKKGTWMSAEKALEWGLVDELREDKEAEEVAEKKAKDFKNLCKDVSDSLFKDSGIPPMSEPMTEHSNFSDIVDDEGNPTQSFLAKTWQGLKNLLSSNQQAVENYTEMIKIFCAVATLLGCADGFKSEDDGTVKLTQDQMKMIDDKLSAMQKEVEDSKKANAAAAESIKNLKAEKDQLLQDKADLEEQVENLKSTPGASVNPAGTSNSEEMGAKELFYLIDSLD